MECPDKNAWVEEPIERILTPYRGGPNLLSIIRQDLEQIADAVIEACEIPSKFDIFDALGAKVTIIGRQLGWPRCYRIFIPLPVSGCSCGAAMPNQPVVGLCEVGVWSDCQEAGTGDICLDDDEFYHRFLLARRYPVRQLWDIDSLSAAAQHLWSDLATFTSIGGARVRGLPGRTFITLEQTMLPVGFSVLPLAPRIAPYISLQTGKVFGFGSGWGGLCEDASWLCAEPIDPYLGH